jgi:hypothetical protein
VEDGITFDSASVKDVAIPKEAGYGGVRIDLPAPQLRAYPKPPLRGVNWRCTAHFPPV